MMNKLEGNNRHIRMNIINFAAREPFSFVR
ncbi:hypothetical protein SAMN06272722_11184 [Paenibacillus sp. RU5A]|nr:hypothetical protein SAMN06272722_11184 [Paenibacillus sp. RU5A]SOC74745.1 hypothetical protein SAMN05880581_11184 [Paenibacillus sp. RU26A]SOC76872.1 hypothetical protein SAMN05880586_11184 [Paenibacillus sp. RU5M]